jgi:hypothetical protein
VGGVGPARDLAGAQHIFERRGLRHVSCTE